MSTLIDGKDINFGTLCPFGPFNRFVYEPDIIWLESGMLSYKMFYFVADSYKPAQWQFLPPYSLVGGALSFNTALFLVTLGFEPKEYKIPKITKVNYSNLDEQQQRESRAIGCDSKQDTLEMFNPRGDEVNCSYTYSPTYNTPSAFNPHSLSGLMTKIEVNTINSLVTHSSSGQVQESCSKPDDRIVKIEDKGHKVFCDKKIMEKKFARKMFPPSQFSGKLRLYLQCIYGGINIDYGLDQSYSTIANFVAGMHLNTTEDRAPRLMTLGHGTHFLFTYNYHHFLIRRVGFTVNPLVPTGKGHQLKRWLQEFTGNTYSQDMLDNFEAYLLTTSFPTLTLPSNNGSAVSSQLYTLGAPFYFGLNANWDGSQATMVCIDSDDQLYRYSNLVTISVEVDGIDQVLALEYDRKYESLLLDFNVTQHLAAYPQGIIRRYITQAKIIEVPDPTPQEPDRKKKILLGDIDDGEWWYSISPTTVEKDQFMEELKSSNRHYGGLPHTHECLTDLAQCFSFNLQIDRYGPWVEVFNIDKIFTWDSYTNDYYWQYNSNPSEAPKPKPGSFPIYAYYNRQGQHLVVNYEYRDLTDADNDIQPAEGMCGPGADSEKEIIYNGDIKYESGFSLNSIRVIAKGSNFSSHEASAVASAGNWPTGSRPRVWSATCGCGFCDGTETPTCCGGIRYFFTHWVSRRQGVLDWNSKSGPGSISHTSYCLIPKDDCQALHVGIQATTQIHSTETTAAYKTFTEQKCAKIWWKGEPKVVGEDAMGWLTCGGIYFVKVFFGERGNLENDSPIPPEEFATYNWCVFYPGGNEVGRFNCNFRKWGPDGPEDIVVGLTEPQPVTLLTSTTSTKMVVEVKLNCYYITPKGNAVITAQQSGKGSGKDMTEASSQFKIENPFFPVLQHLSVLWPYAGCQDNINSYSTTNKDGKLCRIYGGIEKYYPHEWPYKDGFLYSVGSV